MPKRSIKFTDTAFFMTNFVIALVDEDDKIVWKASRAEEERPGGLVSLLPPLATHREQHRVVYDYAVEKGFIKNPHLEDDAS